MSRWRRLLPGGPAHGAWRGRAERLWRLWNAPGTAAFLNRKLVTLLALTVLGFGALTAAYDAIHRDSAPIERAHAPAALELARARAALDSAHRTADRRLRGEQGRNQEQLQLAGLGEEYGTLTTRVNQSLVRVAQTSALEPTDRQRLSVVIGLIGGYTNWINLAAASEPALRQAYLQYAHGMLKDPRTGIADRITALQVNQRRALDRREDWGTVPKAAGPLGLLALLVLVVRLVGLQVFLRRRFHLRISIPLSSVIVVVAATVAVCAYGTWVAHGAQAAAQRAVDALGPGASAETIDRVGQAMARSLGEAHTGAWAMLTNFLLLDGLLMLGVIWWTLQTHRSEYDFTATADRP